MTSTSENSSRVIQSFDVEAPPEPSNKKQMFLNTLKDFRNNLHGRKARIIIIVTVAVALLLLFLILFPISFVSVEHHQIALKWSQLTHAVDKSQTYMSGCYVLGPDAAFLVFPGSAHLLHLPALSVVTRDRLTVKLDVTLQYYIRPPELGQLYGTYGPNYRRMMELMAASKIRDTLSQVSLDQLRMRRMDVEVQIHKDVHRKLAGTCCSACCKSDTCVGRAVHLCIGCEAISDCDQGYHVEVDYLQLGEVHIPAEVLDRLLRRVNIQVETETEKFVQGYAVEQKMTEMKVQNILNKANELTAFSMAKSTFIKQVAAADADKVTQNATLSGLSAMYNKLGITDEQHKLSLHWINTLGKMDLIKSVDFNDNMLYTGG